MPTSCQTSCGRLFPPFAAPFKYSTGEAWKRYGGESRDIEEIAASKVVILNVRAEMGWENMAARHEKMRRGQQDRSGRAVREFLKFFEL